MSVPPQDPNQPDPHPTPAQPTQPYQGGQPQSGQPQPYQGSQPASPQQGGGQWAGGQPAGSSSPRGEDPLDAKSFFSALFDWRFHTLITPKIVSIVYLVGMVLIGLTWLGMLVTGFSTEPLLGLAVLIIGPIVAVVYLAFWRMTLEFYFAIVRMSDDIHRSSCTPRR